MPTKKRKSPKRKRKSQSAPKPKIEPGGEVRTNYTEISGPGQVPVPIVEGATVVTKPIIQPGTLIPEDKIELGKEYRLKGGQFIIVKSRNVGSDPGQTPMVLSKIGHLQDDHTIQWSPTIEGVELFIEKFIFDNLEED